MIDVTDTIQVSMRQVVRTRPYGIVCSFALGIAAFIVLSVLGQEIRHKIGQDMVLMGGVNVVEFVMEDERYPNSPRHFFTERAAEALRKIPDVQDVSLNVAFSPAYAQWKDGQRTWLTFMGIDEFFQKTYSTVLLCGRGITREDVQEKRRVCLLGVRAASSIFGSPEQAIGKFVYIHRNDTAKVVGVIEGVMLGSWSGYGFLPYTTMVARGLGAAPFPDRLFIRAVNWESLPRIIADAKRVIQENQGAPHLAVHSQREQMERLHIIFFWVELLLWMAIAAALLLGGVGIWTGTFSSVRARTHEVGLKKAMGAADGDIMMQFLTEALCKAVAGGLAGIIAGMGCVYVGVQYLECPLPWQQLMVNSGAGIAFSAVIGMLGGIYPASQASKMDIVNALRFE